MVNLMLYTSKTCNSYFFRKKHSYVGVTMVFSGINGEGKIHSFGTESFHEVITGFYRHLLSANLVSQI